MVDTFLLLTLRSSANVCVYGPAVCCGRDAENCERSEGVWTLFEIVSLSIFELFMFLAIGTPWCFCCCPARQKVWAVSSNVLSPLCWPVKNTYQGTTENYNGSWPQSLCLVLLPSICRKLLIALTIASCYTCCTIRSCYFEYGLSHTCLTADSVLSVTFSHSTSVVSVVPQGIVFRPLWYSVYTHSWLDFVSSHLMTWLHHSSAAIPT